MYLRNKSFLIAVLMALIAQTAFAQTPDKTDDSLGEPVDLGLRFTPGMAQAMGKSFAEDILVRRYQLEPDKKEQAARAIAKHLMTAAHATDGQASEFFETLFTEISQARAEGRRDRRNITPEFAQNFSKKVSPLLPAVRDLLTDVGQDVRPLLPVKQQVKLTADLMIAATGLDAFEKNMQRWSKGDVTPFDDPFAPEQQEVQRDQNGESAALKAAKQSATQSLDNGPWINWKDYLEQAKTFYEMDEAQRASADAVYREYMERIQVTTQNATWRQQVYRNRVWSSLFNHLPMGPNNPLRQFVEAEYSKLIGPISMLESEFKKRVDDIPTEAQRTKAEAAVTAALAEQGIESGPNSESANAN